MKSSIDNSLQSGGVPVGLGGVPKAGFVSIEPQHTVFIILSRIYQAAKLFMFSPSSGLYSCPLAMTDGAAKTIEVVCAFTAIQCFLF